MVYGAAANPLPATRPCCIASISVTPAKRLDIIAMRFALSQTSFRAGLGKQRRISFL
jgi:hypothetical protein